MASLGQEDLKNLAAQVLQGVQFNGQPLGPSIDFEALAFSVWRKRPRPPRQELLGPLVVRGQRLVLGAATGEGKSTLIWWIVKALVQGGRFLDWYAERPCRVLIVDAEQSEHDLERLMDETRLGDAENAWLIHVPDGLSLDRAQEEVERLGVFLEQGQFDVVILDPLYKLHTGDPNDEREAVALMKLFDRWRTMHDFALILPTHMRKPDRKAKERDFTMHEIFGASAYLRGAETVLGLKLVTDGLSRLYFFKSRSPGLPVRESWPLKYDRHTGFTLADSPADRARREADVSKQKIRSLLVEAGGAGVGISTLLEESGRSRSFVYSALKEMNATSFTAPGSPGTKLWILEGVERDEQAMEYWSEDDDGN